MLSTITSPISLLRQSWESEERASKVSASRARAATGGQKNSGAGACRPPNSSLERMQTRNRTPVLSRPRSPSVQVDRENQSQRQRHRFTSPVLMTRIDCEYTLASRKKVEGKGQV